MSDSATTRAMIRSVDDQSVVLAPSSSSYELALVPQVHVVRHLAPSERGEIAEREVSDPSSVSQTDHQDLDDQVESSVQSPRGASATRGQQRADLTRDLRRPITSAEPYM